MDFVRVKIEDIERAGILFEEAQNLLSEGKNEKALDVFFQVKRYNPYFEEIDAFIGEIQDKINTEKILDNNQEDFVQKQVLQNNDSKIIDLEKINNNNNDILLQNQVEISWLKFGEFLNQTPRVYMGFVASKPILQENFIINIHIADKIFFKSIFSILPHIQKFMRADLKNENIYLKPIQKES